ncbi:MAG: oligosaccharide flippase family protein, partial [Lachnospiraceae bacterium]|nr:oligosaccharide flippase family protein [Lachnospiraceae bacterium]
MRDSKKNDMVVQAGILAVAGIIVRIIGLLYNTPLVHIIKDEGFGYYDSAYAAYSIVLLISSYSIPSAVSKVMAERLAKREYRNALRVFNCSVVYVIVVGAAASLFVFFGAGIMVKMESAILPLKILAPTIFLSGILGVFRGFFQAQHTMVPTSVSQIIEQIFNAVFSVVMAYVLVKSAQGSGSTKVASMGAAGSTIGTGIGVLSALIFIILIFLYNRKNVMDKVAKDDSGSVMSYGKIFLMIL